MEWPSLQALQKYKRTKFQSLWLTQSPKSQEQQQRLFTFKWYVWFLQGLYFTYDLLGAGWL